jgi:hypothetical protein
MKPTDKPTTAGEVANTIDSAAATPEQQGRIPRRQFLQTGAVLSLSAATGGAMLAARLATNPTLADEADSWPKLPPVRIYKVFIGRTGDFMARPAEELARLEKYLADLEKKLGGVQFIGGETIPPAKLDEVTAKAAGADGLLVIYLSGHGGDAPVLSKLFGMGLPAALFFQPFGGHGWMYFQQWRKQGQKVVVMSTTDWSDLDRVVGLMRVPACMKKTRILAVGGPHGTPAACSAELVKQKLGAELVTISNEVIMDAMKAVEPKAAEAEAQAYWIRQAKKIVEPTIPEIIHSARMFLAVKNLLIREKAQAICSTHCMGNPRGCLTFSKLNDLGLVGACEGDIDSTLTMLLFAYAFRVPGFISDPVVDTAKNALVHFHCTSATKMDGPQGKRLPFVIRTQSDSRAGVALQVENRVGQPVTCAKLVNLDTMLMVTGKIIETSTSPLACRTQFAQTVPDARRLLLNWGEGVIKGDVMTLLHRVVFYGDYRKPMQDLGDLMGFKVIEEGAPA